MNQVAVDHQNNLTIESLLLAVIDRLEALSNAVLSNKPVLNIDEASAYTGLCVSSIYKLTSTQEIPHYKPRGKMLYFNRAELDSWLLQRRIKTTSEINADAANYLVTSKRGVI